MKQNVGILDTAIRSVVALILLAIAVEGLFGTTISIVLGLIGAALFYTCSFGFCLIYKLLGIDTYPDFKDDSYHPQ
ncbi:DUF2892 domain-containing protein [Aliiglaciecola sp. 3_MG-2023]|uniref:YgaP family membrane protein n=1 Tax=Aliiglaciecola sp. 3_MG-2023 TaxID=3062644 RepID=UPI0026E2BB7F|nr:DUF2892 domain-containing protein [Aliiglaciecola sp. 3_MG-2023]MDO6694124.1 DUF2892 domain-containing protein [Aliiglaciecola sp. 3_MG-2023]